MEKRRNGEMEKWRMENGKWRTCNAGSFSYFHLMFIFSPKTQKFQLFIPLSSFVNEPEVIDGTFPNGNRSNKDSRYSKS